MTHTTEYKEMAGMREIASAGPLWAPGASSQEAGHAGRALGSGKPPPSPAHLLVSVALVRIGQEQWETTAGAARQAREESGGKCLQRSPSREGAWGGLGPEMRAARRGIQHGPKGGSVAWNQRVTEAAGSASRRLQGFPRKSLDMGVWVTCRPINAALMARRNPSQSW